MFQSSRVVRGFFAKPASIGTPWQSPRMLKESQPFTGLLPGCF